MIIREQSRPNTAQKSYNICYMTVGMINCHDHFLIALLVVIAELFHRLSHISILFWTMGIFVSGMT